MPAKKKTSKAETTATAASKAKAKKAATGAAGKKAAAKKAPAKKAAAKKAPAKKAPAKKAAAKKAPAKKAAKKSAAEKTAAKKAPAKKAAKKSAAEKTAAKKAPAKKTTKKTAADDATQAPAEPKKRSKATKAATSEPEPGAAGGSASDHDAVIARIEAKAEAAGVPLAEGASASAIKAAEKALGAKLPEEVVAFYRRHDGAVDDPAVEGRELLSLSRMVDEWKIWKDLFDQGTFEANDHGRPDPGVQQKWWIPEWVPVTYDGAGNHHVIDLAPAEGGTRGQILSFWHDDDPRTVVAKDFLSWLEGTTWGDSEGEDDHGGDDDQDDESAGDDDDSADDEDEDDHDDESADDDDDDDDDDDADDHDEAASGDFRRFEMDEKFWSIRLDGDSFTVRFGKQGTDGQEQVKSFDDEATARKEHDKLVAQKTKKGYREV